ncbi:MAG: glycosyltransferase [candidate division Zixibacteria bacterium]|nr:glycosyltransferase [candidate division Zixibacteria bacterium]
MKICYLAPANSVHTQKWVDYLNQNGHEMHLISFHPGRIKGAKVYHLKSFAKFCYLLYLPVVKMLVKKIRPQIVHAHFVSSYGLVGACLGFHPLLISVWGADVIDFPKRSWLHRCLVRYSLNKADVITATSQMLSRAVVGFVGKNNKTFVVPFGVDLDRFSPRIESVDKELITIGTVKTLAHKYGIEYLIRAFAMVEKKHENVKLVIVGDGPLRKELENLATELNCSQKINFVGKVPNEKVQEYINSMDIFVVPSVLESESFGVAAVEASACGLPVIVSDIGGLPEVVLNKKTGLRISPKDPDAIAKAIIFLIENPQLREEWGKEGRRFVSEHYNWIKNAAQMEQLYEEVFQ